MNRPARLVPFAILAAAALAQQEPERVTVVTTLLVQTNAVEGADAPQPEPTIKGRPPSATSPLQVLTSGLLTEPVRQALLQDLQSSLPKDVTASDFVWQAVSSQTLTPTSFLAHLTMTFAAPTAPAIPPAAGDAMARELQQRLEAVLVRPAAEAFERTVRQAEARQKDAERRAEEAEQRLAALGIDTFAADQAALADLIRQLPQVELDLRTEESVSAQLQQQLDGARAATAKAAERLEQLEGATAVLERHADRDDAKPMLLAAQKAQAERGRQAFLEAQRVVDAVQEQATASSLALQRHRSRAAVLRDMVADLQKRVAAGAAGARAHAAVERDYAAALDALAAARAACAAAVQDGAALPTVTVQPWR
jgi:hypothetical protein